MTNLSHAFMVVLAIAGLALLRFIDEFNKAFAAEAGKNFYLAVKIVLSRRAHRFGKGKWGYVVLGAISIIGLGGGLALVLLSPPDCDTQKSGYALIGGTTGAWI